MKSQKLRVRVFSNPKDLTWEELVVFLTFFGYEELKKGKTGGSRRKFVDADNNIIALHKLHPENIVKEYAIKQVLTHLKEKGKLNE